MKYLPLEADVKPGDVVVSSGMGDIFPKGILIGRITSVERKSGALFQEATLQSTVDLSRLEEVLILKNFDPREGFESKTSARP